MEKPFFMVFMEDGNSPKYQHENLQSAETEAKRLATVHGKKTVVLASIKSFEHQRFDIKDLRPETDLPF